MRTACSAGIGAEPGRSARAEDLGQADVVHQRDEEQEAAESGAEGSRGQTQGADIGHGRRFGAEGLGPFLIEATGQASEAFLAEEEGEGVDADGVPGGGQFALDVVDGEVPLAHGDDQVADAIARGAECGPGPAGGKNPARMAASWRN